MKGKANSALAETKQRIIKQVRKRHFTDVLIYFLNCFQDFFRAKHSHEMSHLSCFVSMHV